MRKEERPLIQYRWYDLEAHANAHQRDIECLQTVLAELMYRRTKAAKNLYERLATRLTELTESSGHYHLPAPVEPILSALPPAENEDMQPPAVEASGEEKSRTHAPAFRWPSTAVYEDSEQAMRIAHFDYDEGLLKFMGYVVGQQGAYRTRRRHVLDYVFNETVPKVQSYDYMAQWGEPKSADRLQKLANSIAAFARNAKRRRNSDMNAAILEWEEDLTYLKEQYYENMCEFQWPET